jgi:hypothetical protein
MNEDYSSGSAERRLELEPQRIEYAIGQLHAVGILSIFVATKDRIEFDFNGETVRFYPYTGWHTGKSIKDGRGLQKLLNQLKTAPPQ